MVPKARVYSQQLVVHGILVRQQHLNAHCQRLEDDWQQVQCQGLKGGAARQRQGAHAAAGRP
jgi:hypothetical protein